MGHNFSKRSQEKLRKPVELKKSNYIIRLFSGLTVSDTDSIASTVSVNSAKVEFLRPVAVDNAKILH